MVKPQQRQSSTALQGFLDGKAPRITIRDDEDAAMWIEDPKDKKKPAAAAKKAPAKKAVKAQSDSKKQQPAFKFPWQK